MPSDPNTRRAVRHLVRRAAAVPSPVDLWRRTGFPYRGARRPRGVEAGPVDHPVGAEYETEWAREWPARVARRSVRAVVWQPLIGYFGRPEVHGTDRLAGLGRRAIFVSNHHSHADTTLMLCAIPRPWRDKLVIGAGADYFFRTRFTSALSALFIGAVPVERSSVSRRSIEQVVDLIQDGWSTVLYPEGGRSPDGWGQEFKGGASYLAKRTSVPVVPVYIEGTGDILPKGRNVPRRGKIHVTFGAALRFGEDDTTRTFTARLQQAVEALADEHRSDWWQARLRLHGRQTPALSGPDAAPWRRTWARTGRRAAAPRRWPA